MCAAALSGLTGEAIMLLARQPAQFEPVISVNIHDTAVPARHQAPRSARRLSSSGRRFDELTE